MNPGSAFAGLVLAAGRGTRFQSESGGPAPKVLRPVLGRPLVSYVIDTLSGAGIADIALVVGYRAEDVIRALGPDFVYAIQEEQLGSGHAVACAREHFEGFSNTLIVMCGDSPVFRVRTVREMMRVHLDSGATITLASSVLDDPTGYGRILRDDTGRITGIVEEKCASPEQRAVTEVNGGAYALDAGWLFDNIDQMAVNDAGERNLTDMVRVAIAQGLTVAAVRCDPEELLGVNTPAQLAAVEDILGRRSNGE